MIINENYIAGVIDTNGGFYIFRGMYLYYKIGLRNQNILNTVHNYLEFKLKINIRLYGKLHYITSEKSMFTFIKFLKKRGMRKDYIDLIKSNNKLYEKYKTIIE